MRSPPTASPRSRAARRHTSLHGSGARSSADRVLGELVREVAGILRRHWIQATVPAALLGAGADVVVLLHEHIAAELAVGLLLAVAFEVYVGWAELIVAADRGEGAMPGKGTRLRRAAAVTPALVAASFVAV